MPRNFNGSNPGTVTDFSAIPDGPTGIRIEVNFSESFDFIPGSDVEEFSSADGDFTIIDYITPSNSSDLDEIRVVEGGNTVLQPSVGVDVGDLNSGDQSFLNIDFFI